MISTPLMSNRLKPAVGSADFALFRCGFSPGTMRGNHGSCFSNLGFLIAQQRLTVRTALTVATHSALP